MEEGNTKLIAIVYPDMDTAEDVLITLQRLQDKYLIDIADASYVTKDKDGKVKIHQMGHPVAGGAAGGALWGFLLGALFLAPIFGLLLGAGTGALVGKSIEGVDGDFIKSVDKKLKPESSAVFILIRSITADKVVAEIKHFGGEIVETSLSKEAEARLQKELQKAGKKETYRHHVSAQ